MTQVLAGFVVVFVVLSRRKGKFFPAGCGQCLATDKGHCSPNAEIRGQVIGSFFKIEGLGCVERLVGKRLRRVQVEDSERERA